VDLIMKNIRTVIGKLEVIQRLPSSYNGNPRYLLEIDGVTFKTKVDSGYGYCVTNYRDKLVEASIGSHYGSLTLDTLKGIS